MSHSVIYIYIRLTKNHLLFSVSFYFLNILGQFNTSGLIMQCGIIYAWVG